MYHLLGYVTQNSMKVLYVLEELKVNYEFQLIDLSKGEQRKPEFLKINPVGKTPVLVHNGEGLFESGAICRYLGNVENSPLYPSDKWQRAKVDQWMDYFTCHLGRWLSALFFEKHIKVQLGLGNPDSQKLTEASNFALQQLPVVEKWLKDHSYFLGSQLSIADLFAFAYLEQAKEVDIPLNDYPNLQRWFNDVEKRDSIKRARKKTKLHT